MSHIKTLFLITLLFFTFSCATNLQTLADQERELKSRNNFNGYLALEYLQYSRDLSNKYVWRDADYFTKKGLQAAQNAQVLPEDPEDWDLDNSQIGEAFLGRQKLLNLLSNPKASELLPIQLAHLQLLYDCWVSREKESFQLVDMGRCKILFFRLEDEMKNYLEDINISSNKKEIKIVEVKEPEFSRFDIYFDLDLYKLNSVADKTFRELFNYLGTLNGDYRLLLVGGADRLGKKLYNDVLARKRVLVIKDRLIKNGIPSDIIEVKSFSDENPEILTAPGAQNKNNRRVSVYVSKGPDSLSPIPLPLLDNYIYKKEIINAKRARGIN